MKYDACVQCEEQLGIYVPSDRGHPNRAMVCTAHHAWLELRLADTAAARPGRDVLYRAVIDPLLEILSRPWVPVYFRGEQLNVLNCPCCGGVIEGGAKWHDKDCLWLFAAETLGIS